MTKFLITPASKALPVQYSAVAPVATVNVAVPSALTMAQHQGKMINVVPGGSVSMSLAQCPLGFICILVNSTGAPLAPALTGYSQATLHSAFGIVAVAPGGMATLIVHSPDGGATVRVKAAGELV